MINKTKKCFLFFTLIFFISVNTQLDAAITLPGLWNSGKEMFVNGWDVVNKGIDNLAKKCNLSESTLKNVLGVTALVGTPIVMYTTYRCIKNYKADRKEDKAIITESQKIYFTLANPFKKKFDYVNKFQNTELKDSEKYASKQLFKEEIFTESLSNSPFHAYVRKINNAMKIVQNQLLLIKRRSDIILKRINRMSSQTVVLSPEKIKTDRENIKQLNDIKASMEDLIEQLIQLKKTVSSCYEYRLEYLRN